MTSKKIYTLVFLKENTKLLLGYKTRGLGVNYWNGFGGKVEKGETLLNGAKRELKEESNLEAELKHLGVVCYEGEDNHYEIVHVFTSTNFWGEIAESEEMNPIEWYQFGSIPFTNMWPDARVWFPIMLNEQYFSAVFKKAEDGKQRYKLNIYKNSNEFLKFLKNDRLY